MKRLALMLGGALLSASLSGCAFMDSSVESLMSAPRLTEEQSQLHAALETAAGTSDVRLKYPKEGQYRSAFVFQDLDNNGEEEAVVFYQADTRGPTAWVSILDYQDGQWVSVYDMPGGGSDVDFVSFNPLLSRDSSCMVVGWSDSQRTGRDVSVFRYDDLTLQEIFTRSYNDCAIFDIDNDGLDEMVLLETTGTQERTYADLVAYEDGSLDITSSLVLNRGIQDMLQIATGFVSPYVPALFLDETMAEDSTVTEVLALSLGELTNLTRPDRDTDLSSETERTSRTVCRDVDSDGILEIPTETPLPGYDSYSSEQEQFFLTQYNRLSGGELVPVASACVNESQSYMLLFPDRWLEDQVTLVAQPESGEWKFIRYTGSLEDDADPLLRIRVYSKNDYHDRFESENFFLLAERGLFEYYASLPQQGTQLSLTREELESLFILT